MPRLLLINPRFTPSFWTFEWTYQKVFTHLRYPVAPLGLASVAGLTPKDWDIAIVDENVEEIDWDDPADIVGVAGMSSQYARQREILARFREQGRYTVAGGNHASLLPDDYRLAADTVVAGEAEYTWPRFCRDFEAGRPDALYQETGDVDLTDSPVPRFDLLKLDRYSMAGIQFSRGCPFQCEFCDIIVVFGRKPRTKTKEQIGAELDALRAQGARSVFFVDDNLIGHKPRAKELLGFLVEYANTHGHRFVFGTEVSINVADDPELLQLFRDARFGFLFTGIESPNAASLKETKKFQNTRTDLLESVRRIHAKGIAVMAGFIVGFDSDDETIFERQFRFIQDSGIYMPMVGLLIAIPRTPLWTRLEAAGRLRSVTGGVATDLVAGAVADNSSPWTNVVPHGMSYQRLVEGYAALVRRLFEEKAMYERLRNHMAALRNPLNKHPVDLEREPHHLARLLWHGVVLGGPRRWYYFVRSVLAERGDWNRIWAVGDFWAQSITLKTHADASMRADRVRAAIARDEAALAASQATQRVHSTGAEGSGGPAEAAATNGGVATALR